MNRIVVSLFAVALIMTPAYARVTGQQPAPSRCTLTPANAPAIRGLRLGMTFDQLLSLFPNSGKRREMKASLDRAKTSTSDDIFYLAFEPATDASGNQFDGVDSVSVGVHKGRVIDFNVVYVGTTWRSTDEWVTKLAESLGLPGRQVWVTGAHEHPSKTLKCTGIEIEAATQGGGGSIRVRDMDQVREIEESGNAREEKKRRAMKP